MQTMVLIALILLLVCTAAGLIFLAVTISDRADEEVIKNAGAEDDDGRYGVRTVFFKNTGASPGRRDGRRVGHLSKKSGVEMMGKKTRIVSPQLKQDFENALLNMKAGVSEDGMDEVLEGDIAAVVADFDDADEAAFNSGAGDDMGFGGMDYDDTDYDDSDDSEAFYEDNEETEFIDVFDLVNAGGMKAKRKDESFDSDTEFSDDDDEFLFGEEILR